MMTWYFTIIFTKAKNMEKQDKILIIISTHGDEKIGSEIADKLKEQGHFDFLIGNPRAWAKKTRMTEADLNRVYPGNPDSKLYEERRAAEILKIAQDYKFVIDIHEADCTRDSFVIIPKPEIVDEKIIKMVPLEKILLWPSTSGRKTGPIAQVLDNSIEIEFGVYKQSRPDVIKKGAQVIANFAQNFMTGNTNLDIKQKVFFVYEKLLHKNCPQKHQLTDFVQTEVNQEKFYPLFAQSDLGQDTLCYKMRLVKEI